MKNRNTILYFCQAVVALAFMGAVSACVGDDYDIDDIKVVAQESLSILPSVSEGDMLRIKTRADGDVSTQSDTNLKEKDLNTLDVFVQHITDGKGDAKFMLQYHLVSSESSPIKELEDNLLANKWREAGLKEGEFYNIYVATNNPLTKEVKDLSTFTVDDLKNLEYNENANDAIINADGTFKWADNQPLGDIYKKYAEVITYTDNYGNTQKWRALTDKKEFMMDGVIKNWTPVSGQQQQRFDFTKEGQDPLSRAAAKIVLKVNFKDTFLQSLADQKVSITGSPAWKFNNFAFGAPVFAPETAPTAGVEVHNGNFMIYDSQDIADGKPFTITTYSYPNVWKNTTDAPSMIVSVGYIENGNTTYNYYRIPIVSKETTSLERNTLYVINAEISSRGSDSHEDVNTIDDIYYKVTSWNNEDNEDQESGDVTSVQHYYLQVNPKVYTLRGDGEQAVDIHFSRAKKTSVGYKLFTFPDIASAVDFSTNSKVNKDPDGDTPVYGWYFTDDKHMKTSVSDMTNMGVTITNKNPEAATAGNTEGIIEVKSTALTNRAIKYILMRVYLIDENGNEKEGYYEDVLIRHFPTDNIQSAEGKWSSRTRDGWWSYGQSTNGRTIQDSNMDSPTGGVFAAKYYNNNNIYYANGTQINNLDNPYKYVIQISSTSEQYVMGRPVLDANAQSKDHVVSPAFMIASQLGATRNKQPSNNQRSTVALNAANHCKTYKEVDETGAGVEGQTLWTGWRLPTREEVGVIIKYQHAGYDTMEPVLTGRYYWTLEGAAVSSGINNESTGTWYNPGWDTRYSNPDYDYSYNGSYNTYIRCIRDLSAAEIENINKFNTIIAKYQAK